LPTVLIASGYTQSQSDFSLFTKQSATGAFTVILVYVGDMILTRNDAQEIDLSQLDHLFKIKNLGHSWIVSTPYFVRVNKLKLRKQKKMCLQLIE